MAVLKIKSSNGNVKDIREYLERDERHTERTTLNIDDSVNWDKEMITNKMLYDKTDGRQYVWIVQSFENEIEKENYNAETVHQIGVEFSEQFSEKGFQVTVITHDDTDNLHNHIIINTVNSEDGRKIHLSNANSKENASKNDFLYKDIYKVNDKLCERYGLNTLTESKEKKNKRERAEGKQPTSYKTDEKYLKDSFKEDMRNSLQRIWNDRSIKTGEDFNRALEMEGLRISRMTGKGNITYEDRHKHTVRAKGLGDFNRDDVAELLERNNRTLEREQGSRDQARINVVQREERGRGRGR